MTDSETGMTRAEHLQWCKDRALAYVEAGDMDNAFASFASDIQKHPETAPHGLFIVMVGMPQLVAGDLSTPEQMRKWIEDFN